MCLPYKSVWCSRHPRKVGGSHTGKSRTEGAGKENYSTEEDFEIQLFGGKMPENPIQLLRSKCGGIYINPGRRRMRKKTRQGKERSRNENESLIRWGGG